MHPLAERLAATYVADFASADRDIHWIATEREKSLWLSPNTVLLGRVDAEGLTSDGDPFFGEWKTLGSYRGRYIDDEKIKWRTDPQALTYGVLNGDLRRFTVRWAIKPDEHAKTGRFTTPRTDFEWYTYTATEVAHWRTQLLDIADEIRNKWRLQDAPWRTNFANCYRYGIKYACPFVGLCPAQKWAEIIGDARIPHLESEQKILAERLDKAPSDLIILDATRVGEYLECPENYRRRYEGQGYQEESEALTVGKDFHSLISQHIGRLMAAQAPKETIQ